MNKNRLVTLSLRKIKGSLKRFISLIVLSLLGVSFFIGMKISMPNLLKSLDKYYKDNNVYDVTIISSNGLNKEDINALVKLDSNIKVYGMHFKDVLFNDKNINTDVIRIKEINPNINRFVLIDGRMPVKSNEILIDQKYMLGDNAKIGDELELVLDSDDTDLNVNKVVIVGIINSPIYLATEEGSLNRGNTLIGNGEIKYYAYALSSIFNMDYYTEIYIDNKLTKYDTTNSKSYNEKTEKLINRIDKIKEERVKYRYEELKTIALSRIKKEEDKINNEIANSKIKLNEIKNQMDVVRNELDSKKQELDYANYELRNKANEINRIDNEIKNGEVELAEKKRLLDETKASIDNYDNMLVVAYKNNSGTLTKNDLISILPDDADKESNITKLNLAESMGADLSSTTVMKKQINDLGIDNNGALIADVNKLEQALDAVLQVENGYSLYNSKIIELNDYKNKLESARAMYNDYLNMYNSGVKQYEEARKLYDEKINTYNAAFNELNEKENLAREEIEKARKKVDETITPGTWLIQNRLDNVDYTGFIDSIESLKKLSQIFPLIFFIVSVFISLLSMARMGIEDRGEIGTLKAFGFSKKEILMQYIIYSSLATLIGSILGVILGVLFFPRVIFDVYTNLYALPKMVYANYLGILFIGIIIMVVCIVGSTVVSIISILKEHTISLLRPIAPPIGKKIFLERIPFIWNKITFENKITLRNIFRYKRRVLMTLTGIVSCTMILISAFLIRDSITTVLDIQFKDLFTYDSMIYLDGTKLSYELDEIYSNKHVDNTLYGDLERVMVNNTAVNLFVPNDTDKLDDFIKLKDGNKSLKLNDDGIIITSKLAKMYKIKVNDTIKVKMIDNREYKLRVSGITDNYIGNYIYMNKKTYQEKVGLYELNLTYLKLDSKNNEEIVVEELLANNTNILGYLSIKNNIANVQNMFVSLDKVVLIVVIFSLLLSIVVLYSLAYIIISERQREIATLKVLGFDNEEVDIYLLKEQAIIVAMGIILGLVVGIIYSLALVDTLEVSIVQFNKDLLFRNFIICVLLMLVFSGIVGQLIHARLRKINMIESLKSVE